MFSSAAASLAGTADICAIVRPSSFSEAPSLSYLLEGEMPQVIFRSKQDEYLVHSRGVIHMDGNSAMSKKRVIHRYLWQSGLDNVLLHTSGNMDRDIELSFSVGGRGIELEIQKTELPSVTSIFRALAAISEIQTENKAIYALAEKSATDAGMACKISADATTGATAATVQGAAQGIFDWISAKRAHLIRFDAGEIFAKYMRL